MYIKYILNRVLQYCILSMYLHTLKENTYTIPFVVLPVCQALSLSL